MAKRFQSYSRTKIVQYIREGRVVSESRKLKPSTLLQMGERLQCMFQVWFQQRHHLRCQRFCTKTIRLLLPTSLLECWFIPQGTRLFGHSLGCLKQLGPDGQLDLVHRIDRETSGTIVLTKDKEANAFLKTKFANREVQTYHAIVKGLQMGRERY